MKKKLNLDISLPAGSRLKVYPGRAFLKLVEANASCRKTNQNIYDGNKITSTIVPVVSLNYIIISRLLDSTFSGYL